MTCTCVVLFHLALLQQRIFDKEYFPVQLSASLDTNRGIDPIHSDSSARQPGSYNANCKRPSKNNHQKRLQAYSTSGIAKAVPDDPGVSPLGPRLLFLSAETTQL